MERLEDILESFIEESPTPEAGKAVDLLLRELKSTRQRFAVTLASSQVEKLLGVLRKQFESDSEGPSIASRCREFDISPEAIRDMRRRMEFTQREFAEVLGVSRGAVESWETGRAHPRPMNKFRLALLQEIAPMSGELSQPEKQGLTQSWAGALRETGQKYSALELEEKAKEWRGD